MPNLRKKGSVLTYNDDVIYRAMENQRKMSRTTVRKIPKQPNKAVKDNKNALVAEGETKIPEFVYASDGRKFFPCLFCCHAFAYKELQLVHMQQCTFRVITEVPKVAVPGTISSKMQGGVPKPKLKPKGALSRRKANDQPRKASSKSQQFKSNPKLIVQKSKFNLNPAISNGAIKTIKQVPKKTEFLKIKQEPGMGIQYKVAKHANFQPRVTNMQPRVTNMQPRVANMQPRLTNQYTKFTKYTNLQPQIGFQTNQFVKQSRSIKPKVANSCPHCKIVFESAASLLQHKREQHTFPKIYVSAEQLKEYDELYKTSDMSKCTLCFKPVPRVRWGRHLQTHINEKKNVCNVCQKSFARKDHLNVHERKHLIDMLNPFIGSTS